MKFQKNMAACTWKMIAVLLICITAVQEFSRYEPAAVCEARADKDEREIEKFIKGYYEAYSEKDLDTLKVYITDEKDWEEELVRMEVLFEYGFVRYDHVDMVIYPLSDGKHWIACVNTDMVIEGLDNALPGARATCVGKNSDGDLYVDLNGDNLGDDLLKEMREVLLTDEVVDRMNEQQSKYNDIMAEDPAALDWVMEVSDAQTKALARAYEERKRESKADEGQKRDGKEDRYLVKKGDCLWDIAEEQLGDGMYWSKIYEMNKAVIGEDPDLLYVGIELKLSKEKE